MKKNIFKILGLTIVYVAISCGLYLILKWCGLDSVSRIRQFVLKFGGWSYLVFFVFQVLISTFICVIPFEDELLTALALILFGSIKGFLIGAISMFVTSSIQFVIGRKFCRRIVAKFMGEQSLLKYENYLKVKGEIILPVLYCIPLFPHDSLCILAGMSKIKYWYFSIVTAILRSVEIASICFLGSGIIDYSALSIIDWLVIVNLLVVDVFLLLKLEKFIERKVNASNSKSNTHAKSPVPDDDEGEVLDNDAVLGEHVDESN